MLAAGNDAFSTLAQTSYLGKLALAGSATNWNNVLGGSNDDAQWIILALWKVSKLANVA
jgi:hypothetical protein